MKLDFAFEESPWAGFLNTLRPGTALAASRLLALLEGEGEDSLEDAFRELEDRRITLTVEELMALDAREPSPKNEEAYEVWADEHEELEDYLDEILDRMETL